VSPEIALVRKTAAELLATCLLAAGGKRPEVEENELSLSALCGHRARISNHGVASHSLADVAENTVKSGRLAVGCD
jgi:hypothetical protein